jgi:hypothetical protein
MSALPQKRTCAAVFRMSAKGQRQTSAKKVCRLFDHLVGARAVLRLIDDKFRSSFIATSSI